MSATSPHILADFSVEIRQYYNRVLLDIGGVDNVFEQFAEKAPIPGNQGKSVQWRRFEKIVVTDGAYTLIEGTAPTDTKVTISAVSATISQYGQWSQISDILETTAIDPVIVGFTERYGEAMRTGRDIVVRGEFSNATTLQYAGAAVRVGTSGTGSVGSGNYMNAAEILEAKRTLARAGAKPIPGYGYICFIHPDNTKDIREDPDIVADLREAGIKGDTNPLFTGDAFKWSGVTFIETNNLNVRSSYGMSGADVYEVVMFGKGFYGVTELDALAASVIVHPRGTGGHSDPLDQKSTIGWKCAMAAKILNNDFGVLINCASSRTPAA
jgi:N4-gp56 family major capsid protein